MIMLKFSPVVFDFMQVEFNKLGEPSKRVISYKADDLNRVSFDLEGNIDQLQKSEYEDSHNKTTSLKPGTFFAHCSKSVKGKSFTPTILCVKNVSQNSSVVDFYDVDPQHLEETLLNDIINALAEQQQFFAEVETANKVA